MIQRKDCSGWKNLVVMKKDMGFYVKMSIEFVKNFSKTKNLVNLILRTQQVT